MAVFFFSCERSVENEQGGNMIKKRKIGISLIIIGIGFPLVLSIFSFEGMEEVERKLNQAEIKSIQERVQIVAKRLESEELLSKSNSLEQELWFIFGGENPYERETWKIRYTALPLPYRYVFGAGVAIFLLGIWFVIMSFFPKEKSKK